MYSETACAVLLGSTVAHNGAKLASLGGGFKPGIVVGATDEFGYNIAEDPVSVHDFHATLLKLLGIEQKQLTYRFEGRDYRLTDIHGELVPRLLA